MLYVILSSHVLLLLLLLGQPGNSSIISRVKLRQTTDQLGKRPETRLTHLFLRESTSRSQQLA